MTIEPLVDPDPALVAAAARRPDVAAAFDSASRALAELRFHEGLRRGWEEARAEAAVREATALAILEGARTNVDDVRIWSMRDAASVQATPFIGRGRGAEESAPTDAVSRAPDPAQALALGIWRSQWGLASGFDPINRRTPERRATKPLPALTAGLHRDICSELVASGLLDSATVAIPADPAAMMRAGGYIRTQMPALAIVGALVAHFRFREVFAPASMAVGGALARWVLVTRGVDPTGVAVISALDAEDPAAGRELAGWVSADEAGVARWLIRVATSVEYGAEVGRDVALHVQAGRLG